MFAACGGTYSTPNGLLTSPFFPNNYPGNRECIYVISQAPGTFINLNFLNFDIEGSYNCAYDYLEIRDGDSADSPMIGKFCGDPTLIPAPLRSTHNYVWIKFVTDGSVQNHGFQMNYTTSESLCGGILKEDHGIIQSPTDSERYPHGANCTWVISGDAGTIVRLNWLSFTLEEGGEGGCHYDHVSVYDNSTSTGGLIGRFCGNSLPPILTSTAGRMSIVFESDESISHEGFTANYAVLDAATVCGGNYYTTSGVLHSPGWPNDYGHGRECTWIISVPVGQQILLNFTVFDMENHTNCNFDYLEIRNGGYLTSPLLGRFCGNRIPATIPSFSNQLFLKFSSDNSLSARGFEVMWDGTATGCGGVVSSATGSFASPAYPQPYHHNAECEWHVRVSDGSKIQFVFADIDLEQSDDCEYDFVELFDGPTASSASLGRFCHMGATMVMSSGSSMLVRFRSDYNNAGRGFHARYSTVCNNVVSGPSGAISSPNFPDPYPHNRECSWTIAAPLGNKINITFSHFEMEDHFHNGSCVFDYLEVLQSDNQDPTALDTTESLGKFCGSSASVFPPQIATTKRFAVVRFASDASVAHNGFRLEWMVSGCGGRLRKPRGRISSPNYPDVYPTSVECIWHIEVIQKR